MNQELLQKKIEFHPHQNQQKILECKARDIVICAGRRFGKSAICAFVALKTLLEGDAQRKPVKIWIVSPTYDLSQKVFDYLVRWFLKAVPSQSGGISYRPFPQIRTARGGLVQCKSAENPEGLLGEELDLLIVDECSRIKKNVYETYLYPATISRQGRTFFISTPFGKNWFYEQWIRAKEQGGSFQFISKDNPFLLEAEWQRAKEKLPKAIFEQEFLATFREEAAAVFRGVRDIIKPDCLQPPKSDRRYIAGLDLAKFHDFTVLIILDKYSHDVVYLDRFQKIPYTLQKERIIKAVMGYKANLTVEINNVGASFSDELKASGLIIQDFKTFGTTSKDISKKGTKERLIEKLSVFIEDKNIHIPAIDELVDELESYGYTITDKGNIQYSAPTGLFDDCVMALGLAVWNLPGKKRTENILISRVMKERKIKQFQYF